LKDKIIKIFKESISVKEKFINENLDTVVEVSELIADSFNKGGKLILFGNGGSATDASHIASEFINRFKKERPALPAIALTTDMAVITSIANDHDFSEIFSRQLKALAGKHDIVIAISTSGNSSNVIKAVETAKKKKLKIVALTGIKGDKLASKADYVLAVPSDKIPRIQETHITLGHVLCQMVDEILFDAHRKR
jgi:D-sedoheptulose 7-phosphate isomerase